VDSAIAEFKKAQNKAKNAGFNTRKAYETAEKVKYDLAKARASKDPDSEEVKTLEAKAKRTNDEYDILKKEEEDMKAKREKAKVKVAEVKAAIVKTEYATVKYPIEEEARYGKAIAEKNDIIAELDKHEKDYYKVKGRLNNAKSALDKAKKDAEDAKGINTAYHVAKTAKANFKKADDKYQTLKKEYEDLKAKKEEAEAKKGVALAKVELAKPIALKQAEGL
jgi:chromosome segregation ATPase